MTIYYRTRLIDYPTFTLVDSISSESIIYPAENNRIRIRGLYKNS